MSIDNLTSLFGWMTLINAGLMILSAILILLYKKSIYRIHGNMMGMKEEDIAPSLYRLIGLYKILIIMFNLVPYLSLLLVK